jgi:hypothetical protein
MRTSTGARSASSITSSAGRRDSRVRAMAVGASPQPLDQPIGGHRAVGLEPEHRQDGALLRPAERHRAVVDTGLERSKEADLHAACQPNHLVRARINSHASTVAGAGLRVADAPGLRALVTRCRTGVDRAARGSGRPPITARRPRHVQPAPPHDHRDRARPRAAHVHHERPGRSPPDRPARRGRRRRASPARPSGRTRAAGTRRRPHGSSGSRSRKSATTRPTASRSRCRLPRRRRPRLWTAPSRGCRSRSASPPRSPSLRRVSPSCGAVASPSDVLRARRAARLGALTLPARSVAARGSGARRPSARARAPCCRRRGRHRSGRAA